MRHKPETTFAVLVCEREETPRNHWFFERLSTNDPNVSLLIFSCSHCGKNRVWGNEQHYRDMSKKKLDVTVPGSYGDGTRH